MRENVKQRALHPTLDRGTSNRLNEASCSPSCGRNNAQCNDFLPALQTAQPQNSRGYLNIESISEESANGNSQSNKSLPNSNILFPLPTSKHQQLRSDDILFCKLHHLHIGSWQPPPIYKIWWSNRRLNRALHPTLNRRTGSRLHEAFLVSILFSVIVFIYFYFY